MKFSGKIENGTSNEPLSFGSDLWPWRRFAPSECTFRAKVCTLRVLLVIVITFARSYVFRSGGLFVCPFVHLSVCLFVCL